MGLFPRSESEGRVAGKRREEGVLAGAECGEGQAEWLVILPLFFAALGRAESGERSAVSDQFL